MERQIEASDALVTVTDLVNCVLTDDWKKSLQQYLNNNVKTRNRTILRQAMNTAIRSAVETSNSKYFDFAETLAKLIFNPKAVPWDSIITGDLKDKNIDQNKKWSWEAYFDYDIKRRKKLDAEQRLASMKALYNAKRSSTFGNERMLNLFRAKHYPKVLFTLLKLGADPFETKLSKKNGYHVTLTYAIVTSKTLTKVKRLHLLHHLSEKHLLRADQCGPRNLSPVQICLQDRTRKHALRYVLKADGIEKIQFSNGNNILQELNALHKLEILLPSATVDQFKKLLKAHGHYLPLYTLRRPGNHSFLENFLTSIKELILENRDVSVEKLVALVPEEFLATLTTNPNQFVDTRKMHRSNKVDHQVATEEFDGNTEFPFEHLPVEISEMICANLKASDQANLMAVNKALNKLSESFGEYFWRNLMKNSFPVAYSSLESDTSSRTWRQKFETVSRSIANMCTTNPRFSSRTKNLKCPSIWQFDENWLCAGNTTNLTFWNCVHEWWYNHVMPQAPSQLEYLNSTSSEIPDFVATTSTGIYWFVNNKSAFVPMSRINSDRLESFAIHPSLFPLSSTRFCVQRNIFDTELDKVVGIIPTVGFKVGKKHIVRNCTIGLADQSVIVYDEHMREVQKSARDSTEYCYINILDEHLIYLSSVSQLSAVMDLRMMKILHKNAKSCSQFTNGAYRTITTDRGVGTVWNLKDNTWESTFILPNGTSGNPILNSRYAVFKPYDIRLTGTGTVVLDFDPRNNNKDS